MMLIEFEPIYIWGDVAYLGPLLALRGPRKMEKIDRKFSTWIPFDSTKLELRTRNTYSCIGSTTDTLLIWKCCWHRSQQSFCNKQFQLTVASYILFPLCNNFYTFESTRLWKFLQNKRWRLSSFSHPPSILSEGQNWPQLTVYHW